MFHPYFLYLLKVPFASFIEMKFLSLRSLMQVYLNVFDTQRRILILSFQLGLILKQFHLDL